MKNKAAVELGKLGGSKTSEAKKKAAQNNGKKGGRRLLVCPECSSKNYTAVEAPWKPNRQYACNNCGLYFKKIEGRIAALTTQSN